VICPSGGLSTGVSSPLCKNISLHPSGKSSLQIRAIPPHKRGVGHRHERGEGCGGRGSVLRATGSQGGSMRPVSDHQASGREMLQRTAKSCGPDAPTLASSSRRFGRPYRAQANHIRGRRWQKSPVTGESAKETVKTIACGNAGRFRCTRCYSCAFYQYKVHARPRVQRAPGIPHALVWGERFINDSGASRRGARTCVWERGGAATTIVMPGLDPGIHPSSQEAFSKMDCRA
jgi:hypothetical protein